MEVGCRVLRYKPPLKPGMASKIDANRDDFDRLHLGHIARLLFYGLSDLLVVRVPL